MSFATRVSSLVVLWCACAGCNAGGSGAPPVPTGGNNTGTGGGGNSGISGSNFDPGLAPTAATCGNGQVDDLEQCDDGNTNNADGCNALCKLEADFDCLVPGQPCTNASIELGGMRRWKHRAWRWLRGGLLGSRSRLAMPRSGQGLYRIVWRRRHYSGARDMRRQ